MYSRGVLGLTRHLTRGLRAKRMSGARVIELFPIRATSQRGRRVLSTRGVRDRLHIIDCLRLLHVGLQRSMRNHLELRHECSQGVVRDLMCVLPLLVRPSPQRSVLIRTLMTSRHHLSCQLTQGVKTRTRAQGRVRTLCVTFHANPIPTRGRPTCPRSTSRIKLKRTTRDRTRGIQDGEDCEGVPSSIRRGPIVCLVQRCCRSIPTYCIHCKFGRLLQVRHPHEIIQISSSCHLHPIDCLQFSVLRVQVPIELLIASVVSDLSPDRVSTNNPREVIEQECRSLVPVIRRNIRQRLGRLANPISNVCVLGPSSQGSSGLNVLRGDLTNTRRALQLQVSLATNGNVPRVRGRLLQHARTR